MQTPRSVKKEGEEVLQVLEQRFTEVHGRADIHLQPMEDPTPEQVDTPEGGCDPMESPYWSRILAGPVTPWREKPMLEQEGPHTGGREEHEEEGMAETICDELTTNHIPHPPVPLGGGGREFGSKVELGKKEGVGGEVF
ncbi:uncharacterized protein ACIBXB_005942 [Morphnus guianensis]